MSPKENVKHFEWLLTRSEEGIKGLNDHEIESEDDHIS